MSYDRNSNRGLRRYALRVLSLAAGAVAAVSPAAAQDMLDGAVTHRVIPGWVQPDGSHMVALELALGPGWKTYWRSPGDAGIPPRFHWTGARNVADVHVHWPSPVIFHEAGTRSVGYKNTVVLPLTVLPKQAGKTVRLKGRMQLGICSDICVPTELEFDAQLTGGAGARAPAIVAALANLPYSAKDAGVRSSTCKIKPSEDGLRIDAKVNLPHTGGREEVVIEPAAPGIWVSEPKASRNGDVLSFHADMYHHSGGGFAVDRSNLRITVIGGRYTVDIRGCTAPG